MVLVSNLKSKIILLGGQEKLRRQCERHGDEIFPQTTK